VFTINEPAAEGAFQALTNAGKTDVLIVSVDGGCPGVAAVAAGTLGATSQQYPLLMASLGIEAIVAYAKDGTRPTVTEGLSFYNTGVNLVTDQPAEGVPSIDTTKGTELCWG
jgi:fructose transport system substrate-binding protein